MFWMNAGVFEAKPYEIEWQLPQGYKVEKLLFPVPTKIVDRERVEYIYRDGLLLSTRIYCSNEPDTERMQLRLRWLECTSAICMWRDSIIELQYSPERADFTQTDTLPILANLGINTCACQDSRGYGIVGGIVFINHKPYWETVPMLWPPDSA